MSERLDRPERPERPVLYVVRSERLTAGKLDTEICLSKQEMKQTYQSMRQNPTRTNTNSWRRSSPDIRTVAIQRRSVLPTSLKPIRNCWTTPMAFLSATNGRTDPSGPRWKSYMHMSETSPLRCAFRMIRCIMRYQPGIDIMSPHKCPLRVSRFDISVWKCNGTGRPTEVVSDAAPS